jgi:hypothetical protein
MEFILLVFVALIPFSILLGRTLGLCANKTDSVTFWTESAKFWERMGREKHAAYAQAQADFYAMPWYKIAVTPKVDPSDYGC